MERSVRFMFGCVEVKEKENAFSMKIHVALFK